MLARMVYGSGDQHFMARLESIIERRFLRMARRVSGISMQRAFESD